MNSLANLWPPSYTLRKSQRAKSLKLRISARYGLEVVVPNHLKKVDVHQLLNHHRQWIENRLPYIQEIISIAPPDTVTLPALEQHWQIHYQTAGAATRLTVKNNMLLLNGNQQFQKLLKIWLKKQAFHFLSALLDKISKELNLPYERLIIRVQKTRWGSCTHKKNISFNAKLLFLPLALIRYVIIHELCHTVHMNHSPAFWGLVAKFDPHYQQHRQALNKIQKELPAWLEH